MRVEKRYYTFMSQEVEDEEEAEIAERQEYEDIALAVKKMCNNTGCPSCPFYNVGHCIFAPTPNSWDLDSDDFHNYETQMKIEQRKWTY